MVQTENKTLNSPEAFGLSENVGCEVDGAKVNSDFESIKTDDTANELELQELIARVVKQDQSAFTTLFKMMSGRVNSLALRITESIQLAEEVTEDTFFQIWRQAPRFDPSRGTVKAWILTIARSRALDARRSLPPFDSLTETESTDNRSKPIHDSPPDLLSVVEQNKLLHRALADLDSLPRQLIALSFFRGLSHEEIAEHAELPLGTVKSHIRRAVIHLRESLLTPSLSS